MDIICRGNYGKVIFGADEVFFRDEQIFQCTYKNGLSSKLTWNFHKREDRDVTHITEGQITSDRNTV